MLQLTVQANNTRELFGTFSLIRCWWNFVLVSTGTQDYDAHERFKRSASIPTLDRSPTVVRCTMYIWIVSWRWASCMTKPFKQKLRDGSQRSQMPVGDRPTNIVDAPMAWNASLYPNMLVMLNIIATVIRVTVPHLCCDSWALIQRVTSAEDVAYFCATKKEERLTGFTQIQCCWTSTKICIFRMLRLGHQSVLNGA